MRWFLVILLGLLLVSGDGLLYGSRADDVQTGARAAARSQSGPEMKVTATGVIEPEKIVNVSSQVAGTIVKLGADPRRNGKSINWCSPVTVGAVLVEIDSERYEARVDQERARCRRVQAESALARLNLERAEAQWQRVQELRKKGVPISDSEFEAAEFAWKSAEISIEGAAAALAERRAVLKQAEIELDHTIVKSPIKGVVLDRRVNVGQSVDTTGSAASLFLLADLDRPKIWAQVCEADILRVHQGQAVRFTLDARPGKVFEGKVEQIRLNATMTQNVVSYTVVVAISGAIDDLLPYMTAHVEFR